MAQSKLSHILIQRIPIYDTWRTKFYYHYNFFKKNKSNSKTTLLGYNNKNIQLKKYQHHPPYTISSC